MKIKYTKNSFKTKAMALALLLAMGNCLNVNAQFRSYSKVYSDNIKGGATIFGNTLTHILTNSGAVDTAKMNNNRANGNSSYGNDNSNVRFVDVDGNTGFGAGTRNSSSSDLNLPAGTNTIKLARLYWGARVKKSDFDISLDTFQRVKIRYGTSGAYTEYAAAQLDKNTQGTGNSTVNQYQAYVDITTFVQNNGAGTYTVGNVPASVGSVSSGGNYAGWCIVVVYENLTESAYNSVRVYDGFQQVFNGGSALISSVTLTGLNVPSGVLDLRDAKMGAMVWEGDANLKLDYLKINGTSFSNGLNALDNPWNGTITDTGSHVTTKSPNYTNQMGIDIDQFYVGTGYGIHPGDTEVQLEFGTEADQYFPGLFTFVIKTKEPTVIIDKMVTDANLNKVAEENEVLTYKLKGINMGIGNANYCIVTDTLPVGITYIPGTLKVINCTGLTANSYFTDAAADDQAEFANGVVVFRIGTGADAIHGGILAPGDEFELQFQVTVNPADVNGNIPTIINIARIEGISDAGVKSTDDGTAILEPLSGPVPVTLKSFTAVLIRSNTVKIDWATLQELNCDRYEIERSLDGRTFTKVGSVKGHGFTSLDMYYTLNDDVSNVNSNLVYYRLRQVDIDGFSSFSKVVSVRLKKTTDFTVSPNPFNSYVNINIDWKNNENTVLKIYTMSGREVFSKTIKMYKGTNYIQLNELSGLPSGNYLLQFNSAEGRIFKQVSKL